MQKTPRFSRRKAICGLAATIVVSCPEGRPLPTDSDLVALGNEFDCLAAELDRRIDNGLEIDTGFMQRFDVVEAEILSRDAKTIDGLRVKARAACWALLGDFEDRNQGTLSTRMAMSIIRDLVRSFDPQSERPGAVKNLIGKATSGA